MSNDREPDQPFRSLRSSRPTRLRVRRLTFVLSWPRLRDQLANPTSGKAFCFLFELTATSRSSQPTRHRVRPLLSPSKLTATSWPTHPTRHRVRSFVSPFELTATSWSSQPTRLRAWSFIPFRVDRDFAVNPSNPTSGSAFCSFFRVDHDFVGHICQPDIGYGLFFFFRVDYDFVVNLANLTYVGYGLLFFYNKLTETSRPT